MCNVDLAEIYNNAQKDVSEALDFMHMVAEATVRDICEFGNWMGREVKKHTEATLPQPYAQIVQQIFNSLPFIIACQALPLVITLPAFTIYAAMNVLDKNPFSDETNCHIYHGIAFSRAYRTISNTVTFFATGNFGYLFAAMITGVVGATCYVKGRQYEQHLQGG
jgi:hypothetical protein